MGDHRALSLASTRNDLGGTEVGHDGHQHQLVVHGLGQMQGLLVHGVAKELAAKIRLEWDLGIWGGG